MVAVFLVSIHAPAWGATKRGPVTCQHVLVSIHAPAWGATVYLNELDHFIKEFQSTRPRGARLSVPSICFAP